MEGEFGNENKVGLVSSILILFGSICCIAALPLGLWWHIRHALAGIGVETRKNAEQTEYFEKNRSAQGSQTEKKLVTLIAKGTEKFFENRSGINQKVKNFF